MTIEEQLRERLRKVEALYFGVASGRRVEAASPAAEPLKAKLDEAARQDAASAMKFSLLDEWSVRLFVALCRRYGTRRRRSLQRCALCLSGQARRPRQDHLDASKNLWPIRR